MILPFCYPLIAILHVPYPCSLYLEGGKGPTIHKVPLLTPTRSPSKPERVLKGHPNPGANPMADRTQA